MTRTPEHEGYNRTARILHWLIAALIAFVIPLGLVANAQAPNDDAGIRLTFGLFSAHKTLGILAFFLGGLRLAWMLGHPRPRHIHPERRLENAMATATHWLLATGLIVVPLTGWIGHAASAPLAPILWPAPQSLPFIPNDPDVAARFFASHRLLTKVLGALILLHIIGALRHVLLDRDQTLVRITGGSGMMPATGSTRPFPAVAAALVWMTIAIAAGAITPVSSDADAEPAPALAADAQPYAMTEGRLTLHDRQTGTGIGVVNEWSLDAGFSPAGTDGVVGWLELGAILDDTSVDASQSTLQALSGLTAPILQVEAAIERGADGYNALAADPLGDVSPAPIFTIQPQDDGRLRIQGVLSLSDAPGIEIRLDAFLTPVN